VKDGEALVHGVTNHDGRCDKSLLGTLEPGIYRLEFDIGDYFRDLGVPLPEPAFLDTVVIDFGVDEPGAKYHVPLLVSPYGYSTYRGS
jgi:5-hydroxyisourate hydrolase